MDLLAKITGIKYKPLLYRKLNIYPIKDLDKALSREGTFILGIDKNQIAISWWVSPKRTRSYPYARVYDSLGFSGKKATIIPLIKDEGVGGDRDFLQWDTISLMSLLGIYVIIAYYIHAEPSLREKYRTTKITKQKFNIQYIKREIKNLLSYQSDALHWNLSQVDKIDKLGEKALEAYKEISKKLKIKLHSIPSAEKRIKEISKSKEIFISLSRDLAKKAQKRESLTIQPKEKLTGKKSIITIKNYLGGYYFFTVDEVKLEKEKIYLVEGKHTKRANFPSLEDVKDGLLKMILFKNLKDVKIDEKKYTPIPVLKLTIEKGFKIENLNKSQKEILKVLQKEAKTNGFEIKIY